MWSRNIKGEIEMEKQVAYWMLSELTSCSFLYESTITDCFYSVCHKYNISDEIQNEIKEKCIDDVMKALSLLYK